MADTRRPHIAHWGVYEPLLADGDVVEARPDSDDQDPSPLLANLARSTRHRARVAEPAVRRGWLKDGPGPSSRRGAEPFVTLPWDEVLDLLARELERVIMSSGNAAIYGGSYGWGSAGRFHHAQSQVHRFLNCLGGYTASENTYSVGASQVILPHVLGRSSSPFQNATSWTSMVENAELVVSFGSLGTKNSAVKPGGTSSHPVRDHLGKAVRRGVEFVLFSPLRDDLLEITDASWIPLRPGTDAAAMLALAHVLLEEERHDRAFLDRYCVGFERFAAYLSGMEDGRPKSPEWAEPITGIAAASLRELARRMASARTMINVGWSLQRSRHGEQPPWLGITLAAMLGQIGLPGCGFGHGYGSSGEVGELPSLYGVPTFPQGVNSVDARIPVARVSDMLLNPSADYDYNGERRRYPDIRLVYWCGGNPFHHHQHISRLRQALARVETIVVHDPYWTATARCADIVLPSTVSLERDDIGGSRNDGLLLAMRRCLQPFASARNDYETFSDLSTRLSVGDRFGEGRSSREWLIHLYEDWRGHVDSNHGTALPAFDDFWARGRLELPRAPDAPFLADFRSDPDRHPLTTPSGRIELFSATIDSFGYDDCPGHPAWLEPANPPATSRFPLRLVTSQPRTRLHSQLDFGDGSSASKVHGREPIRLNPIDAAARGIADQDVVRVYSAQGACLAGAVLTDAVMPGVVNLSTGAWYDPLNWEDPDALCVHGNPNVLTSDEGTSRLAQGCTGQHVSVEVERHTHPPPPIRAFNPPRLIESDPASGASLPGVCSRI